tara:strand:+ start:2817 stop:3017 length:201 start_codon:yes stop_codon:yes gene_type:complete
MNNIKTDVDYKLKLTMLIGAMNVARMATDDKDLSQLLANILRAGGCLDDAVIQGITEWATDDKQQR